MLSIMYVDINATSQIATGNIYHKLVHLDFSYELRSSLNLLAQL